MLSDITLSAVWAYWRQQRAGHAIPLFDSIDLPALGAAARRIIMVERNAIGRFRYSQVGAGIQETYGYPMEGLYIDVALPPDRRLQAVARYALACGAGKPILTRSRYGASPGVGFIVDRLILPLARADGSVWGAMSGQVMRSPRDLHAVVGTGEMNQLLGDEVVWLDPDEERPGASTATAGGA